MTALFTWIITAVCLTGTVLNVKKNICAFTSGRSVTWAWMAYDLHCGLHSRALLDLVQLILAVWGIVEWRKRDAGR